MDETLYEPRWAAPIPPASLRVGDLVFTGGSGLVPSGGFPESCSGHPLFPHHGNTTERQLRFLYAQLEKGLADVGSSLEDVLAINAFHVDPTGIDAALELRRRIFVDAPPPASTLTLIDGLMIDQGVVATDVIAVSKDARLPRRPLGAGGSQAPAPILNGLYGRPIFSQITAGGGLLFTQGKGITSGPALGDIPHQYRVFPVEAQTEQTLDYLETLLRQHGAGLEDVVRAEIFLNDWRDLAGLDRVWRRRFPHSPPARQILPARLALDPRVAVEINLIALDPDASFKKEVVRPAADRHESSAVRAGPYVFFSSVWGAPTLGSSTHPLDTDSAAETAAHEIEALCVEAGADTKAIARRRSFYCGTDGLYHEAVLRGQLSKNAPTMHILIRDTPGTPNGLFVHDLIAYIP